jgi:hypothetical protein
MFPVPRHDDPSGVQDRKSEGHCIVAMLGALHDTKASGSCLE